MMRAAGGVVFKFPESDTQNIIAAVKEESCADVLG